MIQLHISNSLTCAHTKGKHSLLSFTLFNPNPLHEFCLVWPHKELNQAKEWGGNGISALDLDCWEGGGKPESDHGITSATSLDQFVRTWADFGEQKGPISDTD